MENFRVSKIASFELEGLFFQIGDIIKTPEGFSVSYDSETLEVHFVYFGTPVHGIVAQYNARQNIWYPCWSHGNYGKNYSNGGTWSSTKEECKTLRKAIDAKASEYLKTGKRACNSEAMRNRKWIKEFAFGK